MVRLDVADGVGGVFPVKTQGSRTIGGGAQAFLGQACGLLLDFDGPVCSVFAGFPAPNVADQLRNVLTDGGHTQLPPDVIDTQDPFDVFKYAATLGPEEAAYVEAALTAYEVEAVATAEPTKGAHDLIHAWAATGRKLAVVSNNSRKAVEAYLDKYGLTRYIDRIHARESNDPALLKPNPHLIEQASASLRIAPDRLAIIGDSLSDIEAANSASVMAIAYANKPGKREALAAGSPAVTVDEITPIVDIVRSTLPVSADYIKEWLEKTGYPFEMKVAQAFRSTDPTFVDQSYYYHDVSTKEARETDVVVGYSPLHKGAYLNVLFAVECKGDRTPWVVFKSNKSASPDLDTEKWLELTPSSNVSDSLRGELAQTVADQHCPLYIVGREPGYGIQEKKNEGKSTQGAKAYDAVRAAVSAALGIEFGNRNEQTPSCVFPVVVTASQIFESWLNDAGVLQVEEVTRTAVTVYMGSFPHGRNVIVYVYTESLLETLVADCRDTAKVFDTRTG